MDKKFKSVLVGLGGMAAFVGLYFLTTLLGSKGMFILPFVLFVGSVYVLGLAGDILKKLAR